jgi:hypothetical protein
MESEGGNINNSVNAYKLNKGDIFKVSSDIIDVGKIKSGLYLTLIQDSSKFIPLIDSSYQKVFGKFIITKIFKQRDKWWKFWKSNKPTAALVKCLEI